MFAIETEQLTFHLTSAIVCGALGGFFGGFKDYVTAKSRAGALIGAISIIVSVFAGMAATDQFVPPTAWPLALIVGVLSGQLAGSTLDNLHGLLPKVLVELFINFVRGLFGRAGK